MAGVEGDARPRWRWDVALSFAGAQRGYVEHVAGVLQARGVRCFYDADEQIELWGKYLAEELPAIYGEQAAAVVVFVSAEYAARDWSRLERRAALNRAVRERREYVLPARFDDTPLPGLLSDMVAIDLCSRAPEEFAAMIVAKLAALGVITPTSGGGETLLDDTEVAPLMGAVRADDTDLRPLGAPAAVSVLGIPDEVPRIVGDHRNGPILGPHLVPSLPGWYVTRPALLDELARLVVAPQTPAEQPVALVGMGGAGKTVLAAAVTELPEVRRRFRDGVAWVSVGRRSLPEAQATLAIQLDGQSLGADVEHNRSLLAKQLKDVACLVVLDDVWDPAVLEAFDCLSSSGRLLVTTRDVEITRGLGPQLEIRQLAFDQSLALLAHWIKVAPNELPPRADELCMEVDHLALGVATVGALVAAGGGGPKWDAAWTDVLDRLRAADLDRIGHKFRNYDHRTLLRAIDVSLEALDEQQRQRYRELAVFSEAGTVPRSAVEALWAPAGYSSTDSGELLRLLAGRSLLRRDDDRRIGLHDLQYDVATYYLRQRSDGLPGGHAQLLDGYRQRLSAHWDAPEDKRSVFVALAGELTRRTKSDPLSQAVCDGYLLDHLAAHLAGAGKQDELHQLLVNYDWLELGLTVRDFTGLLADYSNAPRHDEAAVDVHGALQLASNALASRPGALAGQLLGRLLNIADPALQPLLTAAATNHPGAWLRPLRASLTPPGGLLQFILTGQTGVVGAVTVSADGARAVTGSSDGTMRVWDLASGRCQHMLTGHTAAVQAVAVSADGTHAITGSHDHDARVWNLASGRCEHVLTGHTGAVRAVAVSADATRAITGSHDRTVRLWDLNSGRCQHVLSGHTGMVQAVAVSADGALAVTSSSDGTARVWDLASGRCEHVLTGHTGVVGAVAVSADGARAVTGSSNHDARVWNLTSGHCEHVLTGHTHTVEAVAVSADGALAVTSSWDGTARVWDLASGHCEHVLTGHTGAVKTMAVSADRPRAVTGSSDGTARVWDLASGHCEHVLTGHTGAVQAVAVSADGRSVVTGSSDDTPRVWDLASGRRQRVLTGHTGTVRTVAVSADGTRAITGSYDSTVRLWDLPSGRCEHVLTGHTGVVGAVAVSADGTRAITGSSDGTVRVWDLASGRCRHVLTGHTGSVQAVAVSAQGRAVTGSSDHDARVWDLASGRRQRLLTGHTHTVEAVAVSADGARAVTGSSDGTARVWDLASGTCKHVLTGHTGAVEAVAVSLYGGRAVTGSSDGTARVWDLPSGYCKHVLTGHTGVVEAVAASAHGGRAVTGSSDGTARVWDLPSGRCEHVLTGHTGAVEAVAVRADGALAATGSHDSTVRVWDLDSGQQIDRWDAENGITSIGGSQHLLCVVAGDAAGHVHILALGDERVGAAEAAPDSGQASAPDRYGRRKRRSLAQIVGFRR